MTAIFEDVAGWFERRRDDPHTASAAAQTPASGPVSIETQGETMQTPAFLDNLKNAAQNADNWLHAVIAEHLPAIAADLARYQASPVVQALETAALPPEVEAGIAAMIGELAKKYPAPVQQGEQAQQQPPAQ